MCILLFKYSSSRMMTHLSVYSAVKYSIKVLILFTICVASFSLEAMVTAQNEPETYKSIDSIASSGTKETSGDDENNQADSASANDTCLSENEQQCIKESLAQGLEVLRRYHEWLEYYDGLDRKKIRGGASDLETEDRITWCKKKSANACSVLLKSGGLIVVCGCTNFNLLGLAVNSGADLYLPCILGFIGMGPVFGYSFSKIFRQSINQMKQHKFPCCKKQARQDAEQTHQSGDEQDDQYNGNIQQNDKNTASLIKQYCGLKPYKYGGIIVLSVASGWLDAKNSQLGMLNILNEKLGSESVLGNYLGWGIRIGNWLFSSTLYMDGFNSLLFTYKSVAKGIYSGEVSQEEQKRQNNAVNMFHKFCRAESDETLKVTQEEFQDAVACMGENRLSGLHSRNFLLQCNYIKGQDEYKRPSTTSNRLRYGLWALTATGAIVVMVIVFPNTFVVPTYIQILTSTNMTTIGIIRANCTDILTQSPGWSDLLQTQYWDVFLGMGSYMVQAVSLSPHLVTLLTDGLTICHTLGLGLKLYGLCGNNKDDKAIVAHPFCALDWRDTVSILVTSMGIGGYCYLISQSIHPATAVAHVIQCGVGNILGIGGWAALNISPPIAMIPIIAVIFFGRYVYRKILKQLAPVGKRTDSPSLEFVSEDLRQHSNFLFNELPMSGFNGEDIVDPSTIENEDQGTTDISELLTENFEDIATSEKVPTN